MKAETAKQKNKTTFNGSHGIPFVWIQKKERPRHFFFLLFALIYVFLYLLNVSLTIENIYISKCVALPDKQQRIWREIMFFFVSTNDDFIFCTNTEKDTIPSVADSQTAK